MTWTEVLRLAAEERELLVLDMCARALSESRDTMLHAEVTAAVPTVVELCAALDAHGVPVPHEVESDPVVQFRLAHA
jgi:hypothetical protein